MISNEILDSIMSAWDEIPGSEIPPKPDIESLRTLFEFVFLLSLKAEEREPVRARIVLVSKDTLKSSRYKYAPLDYFIEFESPIPLTIDKATKIAGAFNPDRTAIAVDIQKSDKARLVAWGIVRQESDDYGWLSSLPESYPWPSALAVTALGPGSLEVSYGNRSIGSFLSGEFDIHLPEVFTSTSLGKHLIDVIQHHSIYIEKKSSYWVLYRECLDRLLREAAALRHGGTIVWCPCNEIQQAFDHVELRNKFSNIVDLREELRKLLCWEERPVEFSTEILRGKRRVHKRLEYIAQLSAADGAVIVNEGFVPLCFGSMLKALPWQGEIRTGTMAHRNISKTIDISRFGARHNSAVNFIGQTQQAIAFVISEDGPVRAFRKVSDNTIAYWNDCLMSVFSR